MERSFWKVIFPFFWTFPNPVFKVEDQDIVEQLKAPKKGKRGSSLLVFLALISFVLGKLLMYLMYYFDIPSPLLVNILLLIFALILVGLLSLSISHKH